MEKKFLSGYCMLHQEKHPKKIGDYAKMDNPLK